MIYRFSESIGGGWVKVHEIAFISAIESYYVGIFSAFKSFRFHLILNSGKVIMISAEDKEELTLEYSKITKAWEAFNNSKL